MREELFDREGLAKFLGTSLRSIDRGVSERRFPRPDYLGPRQPRWRRSVIEAWAAAGFPSEEEWEEDRA